MTQASDLIPIVDELEPGEFLTLYEHMAKKRLHMLMEENKDVFIRLKEGGD